LINEVEYPNDYPEELIVENYRAIGTNNSQQSFGTSDSEDNKDMIPTSIYPDTDVRCKKYPTHINPVIENELVKHKLAIDDLFKRSIMNMTYKFERNAKKPKLRIV
jgi:hypothetical protein